MAAISVDDAFTNFVKHGRAQWKFFFLINVCAIIGAFHFYATTFVDYSPTWQCHDKDPGDSDEMCKYVESGSCNVKYADTPLTTSVTEVRLPTCTAWYVTHDGL